MHRKHHVHWNRTQGTHVRKQLSQLLGHPIGPKSVGSNLLIENVRLTAGESVLVCVSGCARGCECLCVTTPHNVWTPTY